MNKLSIVQNIEQSINELAQITSYIKKRVSGESNTEIPNIELDILLNKLQNIYEYSLKLKNPGNQQAEPVSPVINTEIEKKIIEVKQEKIIETKSELPQPEEFKNEVIQETPSEIKQEKQQKEKEEVKSVKENKETGILADKFQNKVSINETISNYTKDLASKLQGNPISDIRTAIGLNDRFLMTKEIFGGDGSKFTSTVEKVNSFNNLDEAMAYLNSQIDISNQGQATKKLLDLVFRRYISTEN